ncbi:hypothetical protein GF407_04970 [candidate division KSB1 bacterium]|nr:hypothetical protein [candidate division KSB1 bacterium]
MQIYFSSLLLLLVIAVVTPAAASEQPLTTVDSVDLKRYAGLWYEIARIPNRFQNKCARHTTAEYTLMQNGRIRVINSCITADGDTTIAKGVAKVVDSESRARLKVSFVNLLGLRLFWGDYWIIALDDEYRWAVVGHPERKYGWILSRTPQLDREEEERIYAKIKEQGYKKDRFISSRQ